VNARGRMRHVFAGLIRCAKRARQLDNLFPGRLFFTPHPASRCASAFPSKRFWPFRDP
jgi:hypothetical protein